MLEKLHLLFRRGRPEQFADVLPGFQKAACIVADSLNWSLPLGDACQILLDLPLFFFEPFQFRLDAGKSPCPEALQHLDETANVGMDLRQPAAGKVFGFPESVGLAAQARQRFLDDAVPRLDHPPDFGNPSDDGLLQRFRRDAGSVTRILAAFMVLSGADVVVVLVRAAVCRRADHVGTALAAKQAGEKVNPALGLLEVHAALEHPADLKLNPVELLLADDRLVAILPDQIAPVNLPQVDWVAKDADDLLLGEEVAAPKLVGARAVGRQTDAKLAQAPRHGTGRTQFLEQVEHASDNRGPLLFNFQLARIILHRAVAEHMPSVPQPPIGTVTHDRKRPFGGHLPLKLREHHDELNHRLAGRHRSVELFAKADDIHVMLGEERPEVNEVLQASGNPVEFEADDEIDLAGGDVPLEPLKLRAVLVLGTLARIDVELQRFDLQVLAAFAELNLLLDFVLLGNEAVAFRCLTLRRDTHVPGNPQRPIPLFLVRFTHSGTVLSEGTAIASDPFTTKLIVADQPSVLTAVWANRAKTAAISFTLPASRASGLDRASG